MGGLLVPFGDALGGQRLAQPSMLVVHVTFSCSCRWVLVAVTTRLARRTSSSWIWESKLQACAPTPNPGRSSLRQTNETLLCAGSMVQVPGGGG